MMTRGKVGSPFYLSLMHAGRLARSMAPSVPRMAACFLKSTITILLEPRCSMTRPTLASLARDLAEGRTTSQRLTEDCLAAIDDQNGEGARAFLHVDRETALAQARAVDLLRMDSATPPSCYAGIPISIKDLFDIAGQVTRAGSIALDGAPPAEEDAETVARLRRAGFVFIGRTNM